MSWWSDREVKNAPHIGRGTLLAIIFWMAGVWILNLHWAMTVSFLGTLVFTLGWEFYDLSRKEKSDGFDFYDIAADMVGWGLFALAIWVYQVFEKAYLYK